MSSDSDSDDGYYGPALPPGFKQGGTLASDDKKMEASKKPSDLPIGPVIPEALRAKLEAGGSSTTIEEDSAARSTSINDNEQSGNATRESDSESDSDVIGPLPPDHPKAQKITVGPSVPSSSTSKPKREEWMLIPPKNKIIPGLGLGPRKFLTRAPMDSKMSDEEEDEEEVFAREADAEIERKLIEDYDKKMEDMKKDFDAKKRRGESLLEIHQKDMKKKKSENNEKAERKTFDRDTDLHISGISSGDKQKYIEKSKELNTKFSRGSRKYL